MEIDHIEVFVKPPMPVENIHINFIVGPDGACIVNPPLSEEQIEDQCWQEIWAARAEWMNIRDLLEAHMTEDIRMEPPSPEELAFVEKLLKLEAGIPDRFICHCNHPQCEDRVLAAAEQKVREFMEGL